MSIAKTIGQFRGRVRAIPHLICYRFYRALVGEERAFSGASERIAARPGLLGIYTRQAFYKRLLAGVGEDVHFGYMSLFSKPAARVGNRVYIGRFCTIGWAELGDDVMLADGVQILSGGHQHGNEAAEGASLRDNPREFTKVTIGAGAWIGAGAIIMADVGERAVVGAGAVVTKAVPAGAKVGGVPAKPLS